MFWVVSNPAFLRTLPTDSSTICQCVVSVQESCVAQDMRSLLSEFEEEQARHVCSFVF